MGSFALELLLCVLAFGFGYAANQGGTCLVVAAHDFFLIIRRKMLF